MLVIAIGLRYQVRMNKESIDSLARRLAASLPEGLKTLRDDVEENFRAVLKGGIARMDLVTREEFDVQQAVLARTREKLEALEARVAAAEQAAASGERQATAGTPSAGKKYGKKKAGKRKSGKKKAGRKKAARKEP